MTELCNLDYLAARYAQEIVGGRGELKPAEVSNVLTKGLGVLQEEGVYACFLYFLGRGERVGQICTEGMTRLLVEASLARTRPSGRGPEELLSWVTTAITGDLRKTILAKQLLEQMLIYARYGAEAQKQAAD